MVDKTKVYVVSDFQDELIKETLKDVNDSLDEKGYDPVNQIVGYLISGDPGYISSYKEARKKMSRLDRTKVIEVLVRNLLK
ncbi:MAG: IreB family regulatory phosphoprotein [Bacilli bacterium]|nr:IreB family regulatory phosphoprotein [Bacilli bacterium]